MESWQKPRYWIIVASRDHVKTGLANGFTQACHGKAGPLRRMRPGDYVLWYSGKVSLGKPALCQCFTGLARIPDEEVYQVTMSPDFCPYRRRVTVLSNRDLPIRPLIQRLRFIADKIHWGYVFRWGFLEIPEADFLLLAEAMQLSEHA